MDIGGYDLQLPWVPTREQVDARVLSKWPEAIISEVGDTTNEVFYFRDADIQDALSDDYTVELGIHFLHVIWGDTRDGECWIVVGDPNCRIALAMMNWGEPVEVGDEYDVYSTEYKSPFKLGGCPLLRRVKVTRVTSRSFQTNDGISWSLRGLTPWLGATPKRIKAVKVQPE